jgi:hypothetical protein
LPYCALVNDLSEGIWIVEEVLASDIYTPCGIAKGVTQISNTHPWLYETIHKDPTFVDDILTIFLDNEENDEISLLFKDGFWAVINVK